MQINKQSVLVTGGGSGMGEATARHLAALGARVAVVDLNQQAVEAVAREIGGMAEACNVADAAAAEQAVARISETNGPPRILVNCAGIATAGRIVGRQGPMPLEDFQRVINVNLVGSFNFIRLCAAKMATLEPVTDSGERGCIINTASVAAYEGQIGQAAYAASKGGIVALNIQAARELAAFGVRVMTIAPGLIGTPMLLSMPDDVRQSLASQPPFPKRFGEPGEFARLAQHIVENEMLNGEVIRLDGALRMQPR